MVKIDNKTMVFVTPESFKGAHHNRVINFMGINYTIGEFHCMLRCMRYGVFMYPDEVTPVDEAEKADRQSMKGFIGVQGFRPAEYNKDPRVMFISDNLTQVGEHVEHFIKFKQKRVSYVNVFTDKFITGIIKILTNKQSLKESVISINSIDWKDAQEILDIPVGNITGIRIVDLLAKAIQGRFGNIAITSYCTHCGSFTNDLRAAHYYEDIKTVKEGEEKVEVHADSKEPIRRKVETLICGDCYKQATVKRMAKSETIGRNEPCNCGSGLKYKKCCGK